MTEPRRITGSGFDEAVQQRQALHREMIARGTGAGGGSLASSDADEFNRIQERRHEDLWQAQVPRRFIHAAAADFADEIAGALASWDGKSNLMVLGPVGVGKSRAAVAAVRAKMRSKFAGLWFVPVYELMRDLRPDGDEGAMDRALCVDALILDDLGAEKPTEWTSEQLDIIVNRRWLEERPIVVTTNLDPGALRERVGEHCYSRLTDGALAVKLTGPDRRKA